MKRISQSLPIFDSRRTRLVSVFLVSGLIFAALFILQANTVPASAQKPENNPLLLPIGGGYSDTYAGFTSAAISRAAGASVEILVLPIPAATDPLVITNDERIKILQTAENRRFEIAEACSRSAPGGVGCSVSLAPILVRSDALDANNLGYFSQDLAAIFILDGDPTIAMQVIGGTPIEQALFEAYDRGVIIAGSGSGANLMSAPMLAGYQAPFLPENALDFGAVDVRYNAEEHGFIFGVQNAILDQKMFQEGNLGRLLNAISLPDHPHLGIGIDAYTAVNIPEGKRLENVFGLYSLVILDAETYHAAHSVQYRGAQYAISMRNVVVHLMPPGEFSFDLNSRTFSLFGSPAGEVAPPLRIARSDRRFALPDGAGSLILAGELSADNGQDGALRQFFQMSGANPERILIYLDGFANTESAQNQAQSIMERLGGHSPVAIIDPANPDRFTPPDETTFDAVIFLAVDQSRLHLEKAGWLKQSWLSGKPVLAYNAAAAALGAAYSAHAPTPDEGGGHETAAQKSFIKGFTITQTGLDFLPGSIEPDILDNNRWGRLFSLAYNHPDLLALGLTGDTSIFVDRDGARVLGDNVVFILDLSRATLAEGSNHAYAVANGLLDVYAPDEYILFEDANTIASYTRASTPNIPTATQTLAPTQTPVPTDTPVPPTPEPTRTPRPTATPPSVPPASNPSTTHILAISGIFVVLVILFGIWLNRRRVF